jgi:glycosyltransferase involved in cell wall biosynthesis
VLPSYREGLPKSLIEAAAVGRAVVTTDCPGCRDTVVPGVTGLLVRPADAAHLTEVLGPLLQDPAQMDRFGRAGREMAEREFSIETAVERHLALYFSLCPPPAPRGSDAPRPQPVTV